MIEINTQAPLAIQIQKMSGENISLTDYLGYYVVLYFYPKDDTPGCTIEACDFRNYNKELKKLDVVLIGLSKDSVKSHQKFANKFELDFELLSDPDSELQEAFGVWVEKSMYGKKYMGTLRSTAVINPQGVVINTWTDVSTKQEGHAKEVYEWVKGYIEALKKN